MDPFRQSIKSDDYVAALEGMPKLTHKQKQEALFKILSDKSNAMKRLGQAMIGPIQVRLRYEGICRNVLVEDNLDKGFIPPYDVLDDLGQAYILNQTDSEVKITPFECKQVTPALFRVASFPRVRKEDLYYLRMNIIEFAQDESRQAIMKQEDARLIALLSSAITAYETVTGVSVTQNIGVGNPIELVDFYNAVSILEQRQIEARRILINPADLRDIYTWDAHVTGWQFKDRVFGGQAVTEFGEFTIQKSIIVPQGKIFILPEPNWLGVLPIMYSLDVEENNQVEQFYRGWVMDELIGMVVLNPRGLSVINKA
jgi:hypothetical protein